MFGTIQYGLHVAIVVVVFVSCRGGLGAALVVVAGIQGVLAFCVFLAYSSLFAFHAYLAYLGQGTYDWIIAHRTVPPPPSTELKAAPAATGRVANGA